MEQTTSIKGTPRVGLSLLLIGLLAFAGISIPDSTGEQIQASILTASIPLEEFTQESGFSREQIVKRVIWEKDSRTYDWISPLQDIVDGTPMDTFGQPVVIFEKLSFSPYSSALTLTGRTQSESENPIKDIDVFIKTISQFSEFANVSTSEVQKIPSNTTPSPLRFKAVITQSEKENAIFSAGNTDSELARLQYLRAVPDSPSQASLLQDINEQAENSGVTFTSLEFVDGSPSFGDIHTLQAQSTVKGFLKDFLKFIPKLTSHERSIAVRNVTIILEDYRDGRYVGNTELLIEAYWYGTAR